jgi:hypothetical protein
VTVVWRDKKFWVGLDMKVHEIVDSSTSGKARPISPVMNGWMSGHISPENKDLDNSTALKGFKDSRDNANGMINGHVTSRKAVRRKQ